MLCKQKEEKHEVAIYTFSAKSNGWQRLKHFFVAVYLLIILKKKT